MISRVSDSSNIKRYYAIGEVAQLLNVPPSMIRFWEKEFPSLQPQKNKQGARRYTQRDVEQIKKVYLLPKESDHDDGELTATVKVRRNMTHEIYAAETEALYA